MENLYVVIDEYNDVKGVYEEDELQEFVNDYSIELANEIQRNYTIQEQFDFHLEILGKMSEYYNGFTISKDDLKNFLDCYNVIAPDKLRYEIVQVVDEIEVQNFIEYINETEDGYQKYKDNNHKIPTPIIVVNKPNKETPLDSLRMTKRFTESNIEDMLKTMIMISLETYTLTENYNSSKIMLEKADYFRNLFDICYKIKNGITSKYNLLLEFQKVYNNECALKEQAITIEFK